MMSYQQRPRLGATFTPGGSDDFYLPEVISPAPQRIMPEVPGNIQENLAQLELDVTGVRSPNGTHPPPGHFPGRGDSLSSGHPPSSIRQVPPERVDSGHSYGGPPPNDYARNHIYDNTAQGAPAPLPYSDVALPSFSPFPKLHNLPPNVPPSDEEKEATLEQARQHVLNSDDPEMQLAWAQDALTYVDISMQLEARLSEDRPGRPQTPQVEHLLRTDAMSIVTFLADQHHPRAEFIRGMWYEFGKFGHRMDKKEAYRCYVRAAERGYARAQYRMGMQHENANDPVKAVHHYQRGVAMGDSASNYRVGMMTLLGQHGHQQDYGLGLEHIRFAADTADENAPQGAYVYGMLLAHELENFTVPEHILPLNLSEARLYIEKAAYHGFAKAQAKMGAAYELSQLGCDFNAALSLHYSALAARQGEASAEMTVSKWFLCGYEGVFEKNEELAFEYAQRAARSGLSTAEFAMGYFYEVGICVTANVEEAQRWYKKAKDHGNRDAEGRIDSISRSKTLSKRDHEQVAIQRIKSQYGSQRGNRRPVRQRPPHVDTMPSIPDGRLVMPEPALPPMPAGRGLPPRAQSAMGAPYPLDDGPPRRLVRPGTAADFIAPHVRASSAMALKPQVRPGSASIPEAHPVETMTPSVRPVGAGGNYRQQNSSSVGPGLIAPPRRGSRTSQLPAGAGAASGAAETAQNQAPPLPRLDIGFSAPPDPTIDQKNRPPTYRLPASKPQPQPPQPPQPQPQPEHQPAAYPDAPESPRATIRPPPSQALPQTVRPASVQSMSAPLLSTRHPRPSRPGSSDVPVVAEETRPPGPTTTPKPATHPAAAAPRPPGKGPKTFDEMGIPMAPKESDCVVM